MDPTDFLSIKERDLYDLGMGITRDDINAVEEISRGNLIPSKKQS